MREPFRESRFAPALSQCIGRPLIIWLVSKCLPLKLARNLQLISASRGLKSGP